MKNKKTITNPKNNDNKCFQYVITVTLNRKIIGEDIPRILEIKSFINNYNWKERHFQSEAKECKGKIKTNGGSSHFVS